MTRPLSPKGISFKVPRPISAIRDVKVIRLNPSRNSLLGSAYWSQLPSENQSTIKVNHEVSKSNKVSLLE